MISVQYCQTMASYNVWQNRGIMDVMRALPKGELEKDRGAYFGSIQKTANHLLWADQLWLSRFDRLSRPRVGSISESVDLCADLKSYLAERAETDDRMLEWSKGVRQLDLVGPLTWHSAALEKSLTKPVAVCVMHFFNHQAHHRGQIHAMLTTAGHRPQDTDLILQPEKQA